MSYSEQAITALRNAQAAEDSGHNEIAKMEMQRALVWAVLAVAVAVEELQS